MNKNKNLKVVSKQSEMQKLKNKFIANESILAILDKVILIDENNTNLGEMQTQAALLNAQEKDLDLVLINKDNRIVKIVYLDTFLYNTIKKEKNKKQKNNNIKIVKIRSNIGEVDFKRKVKNVVEFLQKKNEVELIILQKYVRKQKVGMTIEEIKELLYKTIQELNYVLNHSQNVGANKIILYPNK